MNLIGFIKSKVMYGKEIDISLALLEKNGATLRDIEYWAKGICREIGCTATIHEPSDVITFYPVSRL